MDIHANFGCVVFDFDGTLVDSNPIKENGFFAVAEKRRIEPRLVRAVLARIQGGDRFQISAALADALTKDPRAATQLATTLADDYSEHCLNEVARCPEVPGAKETLAALKAGRLSVFVNSATPEPALGPILARRNLADYFTAVLGGPSSKTDNLGAIRSTTKLGAGAILLIGDSDDDADAAAEFGCAFIGITLRGNTRFTKPVARTRNDLHGLGAEIASVNRR